MKFLRIDLLTLLISLFILGSCKNPDGIGLPVNSAQSLSTTLIDTATIFTATVPDDSIVTTNMAKAPLGYFKDPVFGSTEANIAASLNLPGLAAYTIPTGTITVDSAVLAMHYTDGFYGDSLSTSYKVNVFQLSEPVVSKSYSNLKTWNTQGAAIGSATFFPRPRTRFSITNIVTGAKDTDIKVTPQLRVKLNTGFFLSNFFAAPAGKLNSNSVFQNYINGLYLTLDKTRPGVGGTMFFNMTADSCNVEVYYHAVQADGTIDTAKVLLSVGTPHAVQIGYNNHADAISDIQTQLANYKNFASTHTPNVPYNASYNTLYIQGLGGLRTKISFPYLKNIIAAQQAKGDVVLNRAELVVTPVAGTYVPFVPLARLTMYRLDQALQRQLIPDAYSGDLHYISVGAFGGYYDNQHTSYHYIITGYIEDLMRGKLIDYGTYIAPTDTAGTASDAATVDVSTTGAVAARTVIGGGNKAAAYKMKLNIIFNKVGQ